MKDLILSMCVVGASAVVAAPVVDPSSVTFAQPKAGSAQVTYVLQGAPAVITVYIQTNAGDNAWVTIGADKVRTLTGDVNKIVRPSETPHVLSWKCSRDWPGHVVKDGNLRAVVEVWPLNAPPPWLVIDLETRAITCYRDEAAMPYPLTNELYKTRCLVMRKVSAAHVTWTMGTPESMIDASWKETNGKMKTGYYERTHTVTFTEDYYLAIYPLVQAQNTLIQQNAGFSIGLNISGANVSPLKPAAGLSYKQLRGAVSDYNWPQNGHDVDPNSYLGHLRTYVGHGLEFDLPTESQWEFACRAGEPGNWNTGTDDWTTCCYADKSVLGDVGYSRNKWGFYDMHGNAGSLCLEIITDTYALGLSYVNPPGEFGTAKHRVTRGGYYQLTAAQAPIFCRSGSRYRYDNGSAGPVWALRTAAPARLSAE